ncbi:hypothetical protein [Tenacibaculum sp. UWU-22]|uniref:hypothetical protein n=1 Tax=Tenacibaculum sp. UWU-22 TaxID=3234187 RepID=UPI0034DB0B5F
MKLTNQNIQDLYHFTHQHFVEYYDVQTELVDHLANDIESIWAKNPNLSFEQARDKSFKKFGVFGFMDIIAAKENQMNKKYIKIIWQFVKQWFALPKVILTIVIFMFFYTVIHTPFSKEILPGFILLTILYQLYKFVKHKKEKQKKEKLFLLEAIINRANGFSSFMFLIYSYDLSNIITEFNKLPEHWIIFIAALATLFTITFYIINKVIPENSKKLLQETYPEYNLI